MELQMLTNSYTYRNISTLHVYTQCSNTTISCYSRLLFMSSATMLLDGVTFNPATLVTLHSLYFTLVQVIYPF